VSARTLLMVVVLDTHTADAVFVEIPGAPLQIGGHLPDDGSEMRDHHGATWCRLLVTAAAHSGGAVTLAADALAPAFLLEGEELRYALHRGATHAAVGLLKGGD
jgi:hypothetical protein